jgi:hypothetical protein
METLPELNIMRISLERWPGMLPPSFGGLESDMATKLRVMNVTLPTANRRDGQTTVYSVEPSVLVQN